jgi:hypothetical protein
MRACGIAHEESGGCGVSGGQGPSPPIAEGLAALYLGVSLVAEDAPGPPTGWSRAGHPQG